MSKSQKGAITRCLNGYPSFLPVPENREYFTFFQPPREAAFSILAISVGYR